MEMIKAVSKSKASPVKRRSWGAVINILESKMHMTTKEFSAATDIDYSMLTKYKNGVIDPSTRTILQMADSLNMRAGEIMDLLEIND